MVVEEALEEGNLGLTHVPEVAAEEEAMALYFGKFGNGNFSSCRDLGDAFWFGFCTSE